MVVLFISATLSGVLVLAVLLATVFYQGFGSLSWEFLTSPPSSLSAEGAGIYPAIIGSLWLISLTAVMSFVVGVGAAIYLEEYAPRTWYTGILQTNISNLAGVPSVVYGLLGLGVFVGILGFGRSVLSGALTLTLLVLPVIIIASQEALRAVPSSLRQAALALGATKWQMVRDHVLPAAMPGILTGTILALSRAIGETAPVVVAGAASFLLFAPDSIQDRYIPLPVLIYSWTSDARVEFRDLASAAILVLLGLLLLMNAVAIFFRQRFDRSRW
jgi:phosphate transport system permease protein